jgi:aminomethyltransferase
MQGPLAAPVLQHLTKDDLSKLYFGEFRVLDINGSECFLTRTGYASIFFVWWFDYIVFLSL